MSIENIIKELIWDRIERQSDVSETTLTENIIYALNEIIPKSNFTMKAKNETKNGADIEWWIVDTNNGAITLRLQAKKLSKKNAKDYWYQHLEHPIPSRNNSGDDQLEALLQSADKDEPNKKIPMYCFYNYHPEGSEDKGWTYAFAQEIRAERQKDTSNNKDDYRLFKSIDPITRNMADLYKSLQYNPHLILTSYSKVKTGISLTDYYCKKLPKYVVKLMTDTHKGVFTSALDSLSMLLRTHNRPPKDCYVIVTRTNEVFTDTWLKANSR